MSRRKNKTPVQSAYNIDEEVNTRDYPFYPTIPIKSISEKQKKIISQFMISKKVADTSTIIVPQTEKYIPPHIDTPSIIPEPAFNYTIQIENMEQRLSEINEDIQKGLATLYEQQQLSKANEQIIQEQTTTIDMNKGIIANNNDVINNQVAAYNHNASVISQQCNQINGMNAQIQNLTNLLTVLQNDTANKQAVLYEVQKQVENAQNQLGLHGSMLNAFNMMLQNPEYFANMMSVALQYIQSQTPIYEGEYTT